MSQIFISYAREDRETARRLAIALEAHKWSVFWDRKIPAGKTWRQVIGRQLETAECVIVLWSKISVTSDWVIDEAESGRRRGILVPIIIEANVEAPLGFRSVQAADLSEWNGAQHGPAFQDLVADIAETLGPEPASPATDPSRQLVASFASEVVEVQTALDSSAELVKPGESRAGEAGGAINPPAGPNELPARREFPVKRTVVTVSVILLMVMAAVVLWLVKMNLPKPKPDNELQKPDNALQGDGGNKGDGGNSPSKTKPLPPVGMTYVEAPPEGKFTMGRDKEKGVDEFETPAHVVPISSFFIDITEVTCEEYKKCVDENDEKKRCTPPQDWKGGTYALGDEQKPVTGVTWKQANEFARWAGKRLPTEDQWEYAARGADGRLYPWKGDWQPGLAIADGASDSVVDVGTKKMGASPFGALDMVGNAWEWTASAAKIYPGGKIKEKINPTAKIIRGGSFASPRSAATTTYRYPYKASGEKTYSHTGFRCVKDISN